MYPRSSSLGHLTLAAMQKFLASKGKQTYKSCKTPYVYHGYSDNMGAGHTKINYHGGKNMFGSGGIFARYAADEGIGLNIARYLANANEVIIRRTLAENKVILKQDEEHNKIAQKLLNDEDETVVYNTLQLFSNNNVPLTLTTVSKEWLY